MRRLQAALRNQRGDRQDNKRRKGGVAQTLGKPRWRKGGSALSYVGEKGPGLSLPVALLYTQRFLKNELESK